MLRKCKYIRLNMVYFLKTNNLHLTHIKECNDHMLVKRPVGRGNSQSRQRSGNDNSEWSSLWHIIKRGTENGKYFCSVCNGTRERQIKTKKCFV